MSRFNRARALIFAASLLLAGCSTPVDTAVPEGQQAGAGSCPDTLRFSDTGVEGLESLVLEFEDFRVALEEATGKNVEFYPISSLTAAATALEFDEIDLLLTGPAEYVVPLDSTRMEACASGEGDALGTGLKDFEEVEEEMGEGSVFVLQDTLTENDKYLESEFVPATDEDYNPTRTAFEAAGFERYADLPDEDEQWATPPQKPSLMYKD